MTKQRLSRGIVRRILPYAKPYRWQLALVLFTTAIDSAVIVSIPLMLRVIIDDGIQHHDTDVILWVAVTIGVLALLDAAALFLQGVFSARVGEGITYDLRTKVFSHVQRQPIAFFTRTQTGSLVSRLNTDVMGAQQAVTSLLTSVTSSVLTVLLVVAEMFYLSWLVSVVALVMLPLFIIPTKLIGTKLQLYARERMQVTAEMGSTMNERFNVAGAMLSKLYGRPRDESDFFARKAARVRDVGVLSQVYGRVFFILMTLLASLVTAMVYGLGGSLVVSGAFQLGTLVALAALLGRLYAPITQLSQMQYNVMTALVSFDRVFEVLALKPLVEDKPDAIPLPATSNGSSNGAAAPEVEFDGVSFRYPTANEVSLASLESIALPAAERTSGAGDVLHDVSFRVAPGKLSALVGPSGAGKTTITHLVSRFYDPTAGTVRIDGHDLKEITLESLRNTIGVVTQDAHLYHETIRYNLSYARPGATEDEIIEACRAAQIWDLISSLPNQLDTVVGDRGYRLSGGEKQRVALARLLLKAPSVVVLDEATAHLDSESEAAIQRALRTALAGRTSLVIAHRLSTIRSADEILVIDEGRVTERGTHDELLLAGGLYAELYQTQFAGQENGQPPAPAQVERGPAPQQMIMYGGGGEMWMTGPGPGPGPR